MISFVEMWTEHHDEETPHVMMKLKLRLRFGIGIHTLQNA